jgi:hypothetical protein
VCSLVVQYMAPGLCRTEARGCVCILVVQYVAPGLCRREARGFMYFIGSFNDATIYSGYIMLTVDE